MPPELQKAIGQLIASFSATTISLKAQIDILQSLLVAMYIRSGVSEMGGMPVQDYITTMVKASMDEKLRKLSDDFPNHVAEVVRLLTPPQTNPGGESSAQG